MAITRAPNDEEFADAKSIELEITDSNPANLR